MKIKDLKGVISTGHGYTQLAIVYDEEKNADVINGVPAAAVVAVYGENELKRIEAFENQLVFYI